jgi:hypothetical protein
VLWASLGEAPTLLTDLLTWVEVYFPRERQRSRNLEDLTAQLAGFLRKKRVLLIVDDVWQPDHVTPFRVGGSSSAMVITTRLNDVAEALAPTAQDVLRLPVLDHESALELLARLAPDVVADRLDQSRALVRELEGLPLAIQVAGRLLHAEARLGWGITELLAELQLGARLLDAQPPAEMMVGGREATTPPTVAALLQRSTALLDPESRQRFALLGLFVPKPATFDLSAIAAAWDTDDPRPTARILVNRGLLEPVGGGRFQMHALLVLHARSLLGQGAEP